jgi:hypothetical protein
MQLGNINEEEFLDKFICGLKPNTRTELEFRDPKTIEEAVKWADTYDARYYRKKDSQRYYGFLAPNNSYQDDNRGEPMQIDVLQTNNETSVPLQIDAFKMRPRQTKLQKLTDEERIHLRNTGACFRCRKQGHMAHNCTVKVYNNSKNSNRQ